MIEQRADAVWRGGLKEGSGSFSAGSLAGKYSFSSRFEGGAGSSPEELIGAAHASCFSMAFSNMLAQAGHAPEEVNTKADVTFVPGTGITGSHLTVSARIPGISEEEFQRIAGEAKTGCPVSGALASIEITLEASLQS